MFRKAKALGQQGFFDKAQKILEDVKVKNPTGIFSPNVLLCDILTQPPQMRPSAIKKSHVFELLMMKERRPIRRNLKVNTYPSSAFLVHLTDGLLQVF